MNYTIEIKQKTDKHAISKCIHLKMIGILTFRELVNI